MRCYLGIALGCLLFFTACTAPAPIATTDFSGTDFATLEPAAAGRIFYVSESGNNTNTGLSRTSPFATLQHAAEQTEPGDTVYVLSGTYENTDPNADVLRIDTSGNEDAWIRYRAYPGQSPVIKVRNWSGISVNGASYIIIEGFTIEGNRAELEQQGYPEAYTYPADRGNPLVSGNCLAIAPKYQTDEEKAQGLPEQRPHHVIVRKNNVSDCPGGGMYTTRADYVRFEDNVVFRNAFYSPWGNSGISMYQNWNSDSSTGNKMIVQRNIVFNNRNEVPTWQSNPDDYTQQVRTDGNGIIIDDSRNSQTYSGSTNQIYKGRTYIANNLVFDNGGRGIHVFSSDNVTVVNNTTYNNAWQPETPEGEITTICARNVRVYNNIMYARPDRPANTRVSTSDAPFCDLAPGLNRNDKSTQIFDYNLIFSGTGFDTTRPNNIVGRNPQFSDVANRDFYPRASSPALNKGSLGLYARRDFGGIPRPQNGGVDIGAFERR
jgi:parallel beta-helix repeat protein